MSDDGKVTELLYRVDERTARIEDRMERMEVRLSETNSEQNERIATIENSYDDLDSRVRRNSTVISGVSFGVGTMLTAVVAKLTDLFGF